MLSTRVSQSIRGSTGRSTLESQSISPRKHGGHGTRLTSKFRAFRASVVNLMPFAIHAEQTRNMPLRPALSTKLSAHKGTRAFEFVKDLVLEVRRFPLTCRRTLSSTSSPVAGAATTELHCLRCQLLLQDSKHPHPLATTTPLADFSFIAESEPLTQPLPFNFRAEFSSKRVKAA